MNTATILFGTETGNAEMVADDIQTALGDSGVKSEVFSMNEYLVDDLDHQRLVVLVTSTYGEGELPDTAIPFVEALRRSTPDLTTTRFAAFGLGDSSYDTYNRGIATLITEFTSLGATQIGETGRHDAYSGSDPADAAIAWARELAAAIEALPPVKTVP